MDCDLLQPKEMAGFLMLLNQLICKFNTLVHDILDEVFPAIAGRIFNIIPRDAFPSGPGTNTEVRTVIAIFISHKLLLTILVAFLQWSRCYSLVTSSFS